MDYKRHYTRLIERARCRTIEGYTERHHVIPKCMNGSNHEGNLVSLTPEEHLIAHLLLVKMFPGNHKLLYAASIMSVHKLVHNKKFGWLRRQLSESVTGEGNPFYGKHHTDEAKKKIHATPMAEETKMKIGRANKGHRHTEETRRQMSASHKGHPKGPMSEETKRLLSASHKGKVFGPMSVEQKRKLSAAATLRWARWKHEKSMDNKHAAT